MTKQIKIAWYFRAEENTAWCWCLHTMSICVGLDFASFSVKFYKSMCFALLSQPSVFHTFTLTIWDINICYWSCNANVPRMVPQVWNILLLVAFYDKHREQSWIRCCQKMSLREKVRFFNTKGIALHFAMALSIDVWKSRLFRVNKKKFKLNPARL